MPLQRPPRCVCVCVCAASVCAVCVLCLWLLFACSVAPVCLLCVCCWYPLRMLFVCCMCTTRAPTGTCSSIFKLPHCPGSIRLCIDTVGDMPAANIIAWYCTPHRVATDGECLRSNSTVVVPLLFLFYRHRFMPGGNLSSVISPLSFAPVFNRWAEVLRYRGRRNVDSLPRDRACNQDRHTPDL